MNQINNFLDLFCSCIHAFHLQDSLSCSAIQFVEQKHLESWLNWRMFDFCLNILMS